ncbi:MAG TPA: YkgJ family cysteine cluster protein [Candidatus Nanoarchaeia archaeon]|nr:YkgJ family cysteine cluster protein [Candidatus Nanoarchaeia archaeon]
MDILGLAEEARTSVSYYCLSSCQAKCCRKGYLFLHGDEIKRVSDGTNAAVVKVDEYTSKINLTKAACPKLVENKCGIYADRPQVCKDFPIFVRGKSVFLASFCPAKDVLRAFEEKVKDEVKVVWQ